jgi:hypothetical protein
MKSNFSSFFFRWPKWALVLPFAVVILAIAAGGYTYHQNRQAQADNNEGTVMP